MAKKKKQRKRKRSSCPLVIIAALIVAFVSVIGIGMFFRITEISVQGDLRKYSEQEIKSASEINIGDSLFFAGKRGASVRILDALPFVKSAVIIKQYPGKFIIDVEESSGAAYINTGETAWLIDDEARALEEITVTEAENYINLSGLNTASAKLGQAVTVDEKEKTNLRYAKNVLAAICDLCLQDGVRDLDVSNAGNIVFRYLGRFEVKLGDGENAQYKLARLKEIVPKLGDAESGIIDVSGEGQSYFIPY